MQLRGGWKWILGVWLLGMVALAHASGPDGKPHSFAVEGGKFVLDGKPFQVISGEMHYQRIPRAYWKDRFRMARAMGLNTVTTYVFWNVHEPRPGVYDFSGDNDVAEFVREAAQEGLYVVLRPGPYACAEWELGGYPAWLLKDHSLVLRSSDAKFIRASERWIKRLGQELAPLQIGNGGPIILTQVENEYGSFDRDHAYMEQIHHMLVDAGFTKSQLYTADGPEQIPMGSLPELPVGINFDPGTDGAAEKAFATMKKFHPEGPFFNSEFWDGWFDHWGGKHAQTDTAKQTANLEWILHQGYSVSLYMFHGGTSFGWMNGANSAGKDYQPDVTSYDYDSPLDESGHTTPKYFAFRDAIARETNVAAPPVPANPPTMAVAKFALGESASLWSTLPKPRASANPLSMEDVDQAYGYILYEAKLKGPAHGDLVLDELHDYAQIYVDDKLVGTLDRRLKQDRLAVDVSAPRAKLAILVENTGRVNFTKAIRGERAGITKSVTFAGKPVVGWKTYALPMNSFSRVNFRKQGCAGACFYRGRFQVEKAQDTFLDTVAFTKGEVWVNGHALGRVWKIGPQRTLYLPGPWLHAGVNEVVVLDLEGVKEAAVEGLRKPILKADSR